MKRNLGILVAVMFSLILFVSTDSFAQRGMKWQGGGGWSMGSKYVRMYDPKTVETINGAVMNVERITPMKGISYGVHLMLKTDKETVSVHLGPAWFIENQDVKIKPNDKLEVTGSRINLEGKPVIIAAEVKKKDQTLKLRDESGFPAWSGWRRR